MPVFNYPKKEVNVKVVYYGPGLSGKTTNLQKIHDGIKPEFRGKLVSLATQTDRTLFFDFMPMELGSLGGYKVRLHLYTVPGQVHYNATRKLVLKGVDGIVFVADSQKAMNEANAESVLNLEKNLQSYGKSLTEIPYVIQANKRDLNDVVSVEEIDSMLNHHGAVVTEAAASEGKGVMETLTEIVRLVMTGLRDQFASGLHARPAPFPEAVRRPEPGSEPEPQSGPSADDGSAATPAREEPDAALETAAADGEPLPMEESEGKGPEKEEEEDLREPDLDEPPVRQPDPEPVPTADTPSAGGEGDGSEEMPGQDLAAGSTLKVRVAVEEIGILELSLSISAKVLDDGAVRAVAVHEAGNPAEVERTDPTGGVAAPTSGEAVPEEGNPEIGSDTGGEQAGDGEGPARDIALSTTHATAGKPLPADDDLPPLEDLTEEPLGMPLDGQETGTLPLPDLPREERKILDEDPAPPPGGAVSGYDPTVQPLDFDFSEKGPDKDEPRRKGLLGRFKKK